MASQVSAASSHPPNVLQQYYKDVLVEGKQKWECMVCHRKLSSKQRVEFHLHKIHGKGPIVRKYKRYVDDPCLPVPKRTLHHWEKTVNCTDPSGTEMLVPETEISHDNSYSEQDYAPPPTCGDTTESFCGSEKEDSRNDFGLPVHHQPFLLEDGNDASSYYPGYLSDSSDSSATCITGSEFGESDLSDNGSNSCTSDEEIEKSDDPPTASSTDFTPMFSHVLALKI